MTRLSRTPFYVTVYIFLLTKMTLPGLAKTDTAEERRQRSESVEKACMILASCHVTRGDIYQARGQPFEAEYNLARHFIKKHQKWIECGVQRINEKCTDISPTCWASLKQLAINGRKELSFANRCGGETFPYSYHLCGGKEHWPADILNSMIRYFEHYCTIACSAFREFNRFHVRNNVTKFPQIGWTEGIALALDDRDGFDWTNGMIMQAKIFGRIGGGEKRVESRQTILPPGKCVVYRGCNCSSVECPCESCIPGGDPCKPCTPSTCNCSTCKMGMFCSGVGITMVALDCTNCSECGRGSCSKCQSCASFKEDCAAVQLCPDQIIIRRTTTTTTTPKYIDLSIPCNFFVNCTKAELEEQEDREEDLKTPKMKRLMLEREKCKGETECTKNLVPTLLFPSVEVFKQFKTQRSYDSIIQTQISACPRESWVGTIHSEFPNSIFGVCYDNKLVFKQSTVGFSSTLSVNHNDWDNCAQGVNGMPTYIEGGVFRLNSGGWIEQAQWFCSSVQNKTTAVDMVGVDNDKMKMLMCPNNMLVCAITPSVMKIENDYKIVNIKLGCCNAPQSP